MYIFLKGRKFDYNNIEACHFYNKNTIIYHNTSFENKLKIISRIVTKHC